MAAWATWFWLKIAERWHLSFYSQKLSVSTMSGIDAIPFKSAYEAVPRMDLDLEEKGQASAAPVTSSGKIRKALVAGCIALVLVTLLMYLLARTRYADSSSTHADGTWNLLGEDSYAPTALMQQYIQLRMSNDVNGLKTIVDPDAIMDVDLSKANFLVANAVKSEIPKLHMNGWDDIVEYFKAVPAQSNDKAPVANDILCAKDSCHVTFRVQRGPFGAVTVHTLADLTFRSGRVQQIHLQIS